MNQVSLEDIVSLCKRRGFIYQGSEIYGGLAGTWDYGPLGVTLKRNIMDLWWDMFVQARDDMYGVDAAILMNQKVWQASGHVDTFTDPLVECSNCKGRFREDKIDTSKCPTCGAKDSFGPARQFNMMFETVIGPVASSRYHEINSSMNKMTRQVNEHDIENSQPEETAAFLLGMLEEFAVAFQDFEHEKQSAAVYLRPETAQGIFTNFKNVVDSFYPDLPFGIAQQGKAFRNEISPRDFVFRSREFEQMEIEYFVHPDKWEESFEAWRTQIHEWFQALGLPTDKLHELEVEAEDRAHYSKRTIDFEFDYPHGRDEILGLAYRTDFDLGNIQRESKKSMEYTVKGTTERFVPHVIEPSFGVERAVMAVLVSAYWHDEANDRIVLRLPKHLAPVKVAVSPLLKNKPELVEKAREVYAMLKKEFGNVMWDDNGNIGKRYRRQDEIGTPHCVVVDFDTLEDGTVTVRDRDTTEQYRVSIGEIVSKLA